MFRTSRSRFIFIIGLAWILSGIALSFTVSGGSRPWYVYGVIGFSIPGIFIAVVTLGVRVLEWADRGEK